MSSDTISLKEKASFGIGAVGKDMAYWIMAAYLMIFFTDVVGLSPIYVGILFAGARIWDAINDPIMGWIVDNTKTRWGKFRPWILIGTIVNSVIVLFLFWNPVGTFGEDGSSAGVMAWCGIFYILWGMSYTLMDIPYWSFIPAFSSDSKVRDLMSVIPRTCAMIGGQFVVIFGLPIIAMLSFDGNASAGYFNFTIFVVVCFIIAEIICVANIREHVQTPLRHKISVGDMLHLLVRNDQLVVIIVLTVIQQIAANLVNGTILYYFKYALQNEAVYPYFMAAGAVAQFVAFLAFPVLVRATSRRFVYVLSASLMIVGYLLMFLFGSQADSSALVAGGSFCIASMGNALALVSTTVMLADTVDYGEYKLGTRSESIVFSMQTMTVKFGNALAGFMSSMTLAIVGYIPNQEQTPETLLGLRVVMFVLSAAMLFVMLVMYLKFYKLNGEFYKNVLSALEVSRQKARSEKESRYVVRYSLAENHMLLKTSAASRDEIINKMVDTLKGSEYISDIEALRSAVFAREAQASTGMGEGIAIPHAKVAGITHAQIVIATLDHGVDFGADDKRPADLICLIASPDDGNSHLETIGRLGILLNDQALRSAIRSSTDPVTLIETIQRAEKALTQKA